MEAPADLIAACPRTEMLTDSISIMTANLAQRPCGNPPKEVVRPLLEEFAARAIAMTLAQIDGPPDPTSPDCRKRIVDAADAALDCVQDELLAEFFRRFKATWPRPEPGFWGRVKFIWVRHKHRRRGLPVGIMSYGLSKLAYVSAAVALCALCGLDPEVTLEPTEEESLAYLRAVTEAFLRKGNSGNGV